jgi:hypothetical protein
MSEFICQITGKLCLRPGEPVEGAKEISDSGYCGGKKLSDGICLVVLKQKRQDWESENHLLNKPSFERRGPNKVVVFENPDLRLGSRNMAFGVINGEI